MDTQIVVYSCSGVLLSKEKEKTIGACNNMDKTQRQYVQSNKLDTKGDIHYGSEHCQFNSVAQLYPILCDPTDYSTPGFPVHHQLPELAQTCVH